MSTSTDVGSLSHSLLGEVKLLNGLLSGDEGKAAMEINDTIYICFQILD